MNENASPAVLLLSGVLFLDFSHSNMHVGASCCFNVQLSDDK